MNPRALLAFSALLAALPAACSNDDPALASPRAALCDVVDGLCDGPPVTAPMMSHPVQVAPSAALPAQVVSQAAHNNLDVAFHQGRLFFAFRTAPNHFANADAVMYVVSSPDLATWRFEGAFALGTDVREPQLLSVDDDTLRFYFAELGDNPFDFTPRGVKVTTWAGPGQWTAVQDIFDPGFLVWRVKPVGDWIYAFGYDGGENVYDNDGEPIRVEWLRSRDGLAWEPVIPGQPVVLQGGASETDFVWLADGTLIAVSRNEAGDASGFGSKICRAEASAQGDWRCENDPRKYDSPLLFSHNDAVYLIGRRNVTETGHYDLGRDDLPLDERFIEYQRIYWTQPKRCAVWQVDPATLRVTHLQDLPSRGDTCFPEALRLDEHRWLVFNYTSPLDGDDVAWVDGQVGDTSIYWLVLTLP